MSLPDSSKTRKRRTSSDDDGDQHRSKRVRLTSRNLALFDKITSSGWQDISTPALSHSMADIPPPEPGQSGTCKTTSTTMSKFPALTRLNGLRDPALSKAPSNIKDIIERHARPNESVPPISLSEHGEYVTRIGKIFNETTLASEFSKSLLNYYNDENYSQVQNAACTGFPKDAPFRKGLSTPQPDFVEGLVLKAFDEVPVHLIQGAVIHGDEPRSLVLPHLAGEWKKPEARMDLAVIQAGYVGASLVFARTQALSFMGRADRPGYAAVTTFISNGEVIRFYAHYAVPTGGKLVYHQYQYATGSLTTTYQAFMDAKRALWNQQAYAREQSYALKDELLTHWDQLQNLTAAERASLAARAGVIGEAEHLAVPPVFEQSAFEQPRDSLYPSDGGPKRKAPSPSPCFVNKSSRHG